jgi:hypothetical protein
MRARRLSVPPRWPRKTAVTARLLRHPQRSSHGAGGDHAGALRCLACGVCRSHVASYSGFAASAASPGGEEPVLLGSVPLGPGFGQPDAVTGREEAAQGGEGDNPLLSSVEEAETGPAQPSRDLVHHVQPSINLVGSGDAWSGYATDGDTPTPRDAVKWLDAFGLKALSRAGTGRQPAEELSWRRKRKPMGASSKVWRQRCTARRTLRWSNALRPRATTGCLFACAATRRRTWWPVGGQRREGNDRGDAARLPKRERLRRVKRHRERRRRRESPPAQAQRSFDGNVDAAPREVVATRARRVGTPRQRGAPATAGRTASPRRTAGAWQHAPARFQGRTSGQQQATWRGCGGCAVRKDRVPVDRSGGDTTSELRISHRGQEPARTGNVANPMAGSRVQQTCKAKRGENRRSREKRQGRNESGLWQARAEGRRSLGSRGWEWTRSADVGGGAIIDNPMRGVRSGDRSSSSNHPRVEAGRRPESRTDRTKWPASSKERTRPWRTRQGTTRSRSTSSRDDTP